MKYTFVTSLFILLTSIGLGQIINGDSLLDNFYKHFTGTIAGQTVIADIQSINGVVSGSYEYQKYREPIELTYIVSQSKGTTITFGENIDEDDTTQPYPIWKCAFINEQLSGKWYSADRKKTYPVSLEENYPQGVMRFTYNYFDTAADAMPKKKNTTACEVEYSYPVAVGNNSDAHWLNNEIKSLAGFDTTLFFKTGLQKSVNDYIKDYRKNILSDTADYNSNAGNWLSNIDISIRYNSHDYVILDEDLYEYSGGAHGNSARGYHCYDIKNKTELKLSDITTADSLTLQHLLEAQFRIDNDINPTDTLTGILFENHLPANDNFSFDDTGIYFTYNPYEVAPYAAGIFTVFISYDKLKGKLVASFAKRMNIQK